MDAKPTQAERCGKEKPAIDGQTPFGGRRPGPIARAAWSLATARGASSGLRRFLRKRLALRFRGPYDVAADGLGMRVYPAENHCDRTVLGRGELPEKPERALIEPLLANGMTFVDIGANVGVYSLFVSQRTGGTATVLAFEPHPRTFAKLDFNCAQNGFDRIVRVNAGVAGTEAETVLFSDGGGNIGNASLLKSVGIGREEIAIRLRPLAAVLAEQAIDRIDLLKIDVEGFEDQALMPFFETAPADLWPSYVLLETVHRGFWRYDLESELVRRGYTVIGSTEENLLLGRAATQERVGAAR